MKRFFFTLALLVVPALASAQDTCAPEIVTDVSAFMIGRTSVILHFTAPHEDCSSCGAVSEYAIRYSTSTITESNFWSATAFSELPSPPQSPGNTECADTIGLSPGTTYYVALKSKDDGNNWSAVSNVVSFTTHTTGTSPVCP